MPLRDRRMGDSGVEPACAAGTTAAGVWGVVAAPAAAWSAGVKGNGPGPLAAEDASLAAAAGVVNKGRAVCTPAAAEGAEADAPLLLSPQP